MTEAATGPILYSLGFLPLVASRVLKHSMNFTPIPCKGPARAMGHLHYPGDLFLETHLHQTSSSIEGTVWLWLVAQSCPTLCDPTDYSPPGSSVHGDSPGKNTGVGCHALAQGTFPTSGLNPALPHCRRFFTLSHEGSPNEGTVHYRLNWLLPTGLEPHPASPALLLQG